MHRGCEVATESVAPARIHTDRIAPGQGACFIFFAAQPRLAPNLGLGTAQEHRFPAGGGRGGPGGFRGHL